MLKSSCTSRSLKMLLTIDEAGKMPLNKYRQDKTNVLMAIFVSFFMTELGSVQTPKLIGTPQLWFWPSNMLSGSIS